jgi:tRNA(Ile)-lysidine synthase
MTALEAARASGLVREGAPLLVLLSGGADSVCLLDVSVRLGASVVALHVNYGLRPEAGEDEDLCRSLCSRLGVPLSVERVELGAGNAQAAAREARYALAEKLATGDYAAAHTASDQAETVLYRLAWSPGGGGSCARSWPSGGGTHGSGAPRTASRGGRTPRMPIPVSRARA